MKVTEFQRGKRAHSGAYARFMQLQGCDSGAGSSIHDADGSLLTCRTRQGNQGPSEANGQERRDIAGSRAHQT